MLPVMWQACFLGPVFLVLAEMRNTTKDNKWWGLLSTLWRSARGTISISPTLRWMTFAVLCLPRLPGQLKLPWRFKPLFPSMLAGRLHPFPSCCSKFIYFTIFHRRSSSFCLSSGDTLHESEPEPTYRTGLPSTLQQIWCFRAYFCVGLFFFCLQEVWIRGILGFVVHEWWLLTKGSFGDQRLKT